ncbi:MAG: glycosyltransferase family 2 protein [Candidatus Bathyarchaeota archaeon]|jgi:glycosyltransferase involved in cell wall biosynthesis|nr:glycosyltransferase family 2 protein [Candidatus Termiticorpusculum sp.]
MIPTNIPFSEFSNIDIGVVIPTFNEEQNIGDVLSELYEFGYHNVLVIDGLSSDGTLQVAAKNGVKTIIQNGHGKGQAIRQVLQNNYLNTDITVLMDADGSMSPDELSRFIKAIHNGADIVKGSRFLCGGGTYDMTRVRKFGNSAITSLVNLFYSSNYTDVCYGFIALTKNAVNKLSAVLESDGFDIETELFIKAKQLNLKVVEVPSIEYQRKHGESNLHSLSDGFKIFKKIVGLALPKR